jgi:hypothetical protein
MVNEFQNLNPQDDAKKESSVFTFEAKQNLKAFGSSGTEVFGGIFSEEYLSKLQSTDAAFEYDKMRRSEPQIAMVLAAVMNPIKSANWEFEAASEDADAIKQKELVEAILKEQIDWDKFLHEALTLVPFGHAVFETVHNVVIGHKKFGTFNGLAQLGFRSQKTLDFWRLNKETGKLEGIDQVVQSDIGKSCFIPGQFLLVMTLNQEGDNYEGISALRPVYGPYVRKNLYQRLSAIGIEKYAIGTPIGKMPEGKDTSSPDYQEFQKVLRSYTSHETAFVIVPNGYEIEINRGDFDASKIKEIILMENTEMVNAFVANFLSLGLNGSGGSFSLGTDLSDFFLSGIQAYANIITGCLNRKLIPDLIKMNFGEQESYPKIKCSGINDKAGKELADIISVLAGAQALKPDAKLEDFLRKSYDLPKVDAATTRVQQAPAFKFAEKMSSREWKKEFKTNKEELTDLMSLELGSIYLDIKKQLKSKYEKASSAEKIKVATQVDPKGVSSYQAKLKDLLAKIAFNSIDDAKKEVPKSVRLSERFLLADRPRGGYYAALPPHVKKLIDAQSLLISGSQVADLEKVTYFQFVSSATSTESIDTILNDIDQKVEPLLANESNAGMSLDVAASNATATVTNQARLAFFFDPEVLETIESFTFTNEDPISEVCQELNGQTFAVGDPDLDRYSPPMHHNCKSRLVPNLKGDKNPKIDRGVSLSPGALKSISLHEHHECKHPGYGLIKKV